MSVSANQVTSRRDGCRKKQPVAASTRLYQRTLVFTNASGYADDDCAAGVNKFSGIAVDEADNSSGNNGDINVELFEEGEFLLTGTGFSQASVGLPALASDNYTIAAGGGVVNGVYIGPITEYVSATQVWVKLDVADIDRDAGTVAATGSVQGDAAQLTNGVNSVTGADATKGVLLPPCSAGKEVAVYNTHATNGLKIWPASGDDINDGSADAAITIEGKTVARFVGLDNATWAAQFTANT